MFVLEKLKIVLEIYKNNKIILISF